MSRHVHDEPPEVDIIAAVYQGAPYIGAFLASLAAQTHAAWRLWIRDDGSTDETAAIVARAARGDPRIRIVRDAAARLGAAQSFARLLEQLPTETEYVMCADQDDVWLPDKISRTLGVMRAAEGERAGPLLVHTDLAVVDESLNLIHPSFWAYSGVRPEPATLRRVMVQNVATGATTMLNRALRIRVGKMPAGALYHDWWHACVAAAFGRVVAVPEATMLYRQHGGNAVGATRRDLRAWTRVPAMIHDVLARREEFRAEFRLGARQAGAFLERYGHELDDADRRFLARYAQLPDRQFVRRKIDVVRFRLRREFGILRNLGVLWRA